MISNLQIIGVLLTPLLLCDGMPSTDINVECRIILDHSIAGESCPRFYPCRFAITQYLILSKMDSSYEMFY